MHLRSNLCTEPEGKDFIVNEKLNPIPKEDWRERLLDRFPALLKIQEYGFGGEVDELIEHFHSEISKAQKEERQNLLEELRKEVEGKWNKKWGWNLPQITVQEVAEMKMLIPSSDECLNFFLALLETKKKDE